MASDVNKRSVVRPSTTRGRSDDWAVVTLEMALVGSLRCRRLACDYDPISSGSASRVREFGCSLVGVSRKAERQRIRHSYARPLYVGEAFVWLGGNQEDATSLFVECP